MYVLGSFLKVKVKEKGYLLGLLKFQIFLGCLKFMIFFFWGGRGVNGRCWPEPTYGKKESTPPGSF